MTPKFAVRTVSGAAMLEARGRVDALALAGAAYRMTAEAYVALGKKAVWLHPKKKLPAKAMAERFTAEYAEQLAFWRRARARKAERLEESRRALAQASPAAPGEPAFGALAPEREAEIAALLAEPPIADALGVARAWTQARRR